MHRSDDDDDKKPDWPAWAVGARFRGARCFQIIRIYFHITSPTLRSREILIKGRKEPVLSSQIPQDVEEDHILVEGSTYL